MRKQCVPGVPSSSRTPGYEATAEEANAMVATKSMMADPTYLQRRKPFTFDTVGVVSKKKTWHFTGSTTSHRLRRPSRGVSGTAII